MAGALGAARHALRGLLARHEAEGGARRRPDPPAPPADPRRAPDRAGRQYGPRGEGRAPRPGRRRRRRRRHHPYPRGRRGPRRPDRHHRQWQIAGRRDFGRIARAGRVGRSDAGGRLHPADQRPGRFMTWLMRRLTPGGFLFLMLNEVRLATRAARQRRGGNIIWGLLITFYTAMGFWLGVTLAEIPIHASAPGP